MGKPLISSAVPVYRGDKKGTAAVHKLHILRADQRARQVESENFQHRPADGEGQIRRLLCEKVKVVPEQIPGSVKAGLLQVAD